MRKRLALAGTVAAIAATVFLAGGTLRDSAGPPAARSAVTAPAAGRLQAGFAAGDTTALVRSVHEQLRTRPTARGFQLLGLAYQQRARETGNPVYYSRSERALLRASRLAPNDPDTVSAQASLALARHEFRRALRLGRRAQQLAPYTARHHGVVGDALIELGRYDDAFRAFDRMAALKPSLSAYARVSYARELLGDSAGAEAAMKLAIEASGGQPEPAAWAHTQLGKLYFSVGRIEEAGEQYESALGIFPGYVYALEPLALVEHARGHARRAVALATRAAETLPLPQSVATLGDLHAHSGNRRAARQQYALVRAIGRVLAANGVRTDLETALFDVDHGIRLPNALANARRAHRTRPSIEADDVLAWALARNGRCAEALPYSSRALRLGTRDALKLFHRGMIQRCLGHQAQARSSFRRALALNPQFSVLWSPVARRYAT